MQTKLETIDLDWSRLDHDAVHSHADKVLLLYTSPYPLHHQRHLYNHLREPTTTSNETIEHLRWTLDCDPCSIDGTLAHLKPVHSLHLYADIHVRPTRVDPHHAHRVFDLLGDLVIGVGVVCCPSASVSMSSKSP